MSFRHHISMGMTIQRKYDIWRDDNDFFEVVTRQKQNEFITTTPSSPIWKGGAAAYWDIDIIEEINARDI